MMSPPLTTSSGDIASPLAANRGVRLESRVPDEVTIHADKDRILQVLGNIVGNAVKFTSERGLVTISVEHRPAEVVISVADTGAGIDPGALPHLFDRFYSSARGHAGTGLD